jgi:signal transduction histidine kinase
MIMIRWLKKIDPRWKYIMLGGWLVFTMALAGWLFYFSYEQIIRLQNLGGEELTQAVRYQRMLLWESTVLFSSLLLGAVALAFYMVRDQQQSRKIKNFFLTFTHELKTPLASIQLQAESLAEDLGDGQHKVLIDRLNSDANRLAIQLENSLYLAEGDRRQLHIERIILPEDISYLLLAWPGLKVSLVGHGSIKADKRAFESIVRNILKNSMDHGQSTEMSIDIKSQSSDTEIVFKDNGGGFSGKASELGELFERPYSGSGNGIGLHLIKRLIESMDGTFEVIETTPNFAVRVLLPN